MIKPILGITMGDPASIGPEITVKALARPEIYEKCRPIVVGDACMLERARRVTGLEDIRLHAVTAPAEAEYRPASLINAIGYAARLAARRKEERA